MATPINTVVLFLRRRDNYFAVNTKSAVESYFRTLNDVTINGIETPVSKYVTHVWNGLDYADYVTLLQKIPNDKVKTHEIYTEYKKKISAKNDAKLFEAILSIEAEKLLYFILAYPQKIVIVKSGEKDVEKRFLGYEFSNRRGSEGIHAIQRGKSIDECTQLFDVNSNNNPEKASTYIRQAFKGNYHSIIADNMKSHVSRSALIDMLTFDRDTYDKSISLTVKKKVIIDSKYPQIKIADLFLTIKNGKNVRQSDAIGGYRVSRIESIANAEFDIKATKWTTDKVDEQDFLQKGDILFSHINSVKYLGKTGIFDSEEKVVHGINLLRFRANNLILPEYAYAIFKLPVFMTEVQKYAIKAANQASVNISNIKGIRIPVPPIDIQKQIVEEIYKVNESVSSSIQLIKKVEEDVEGILSSINFENGTLNTIAPFVTKSIKYNDIVSETYITTDNMLQNKLGVVPFIGEANISSITEYKKDDILISNIRPYLKKIWFADKEGGCSKDVLVLRSVDASKYLPKYIFYMVRRDAFFDYVMEGKKGVKMPRGNKEDIQKYRIPIPPIEEQKRIVSQIEALELEITNARNLIENAASEKQAILDKYL